VFSAIIITLFPNIFALYYNIRIKKIQVLFFNFYNTDNNFFKSLFILTILYVKINIFEDKANIDEYAYEPLCWLTMNKVLTGVDATHISPKTLTTRAQLAIIIQKFSTLMEVE